MLSKGILCYIFHFYNFQLICVTQCGKEYKNKVSLRVHKKNTHGRKVINGKEEKIPCTICNAEFTRKGNMLKHVRDVHEGIKNFKCEICSRAFSSITVSQKSFHN